MTLSQFISDNTGEAVSYDGVTDDKGQCEQLVCLWWEQAYGFKCPLVPYAKDLWSNPVVLASFEQILPGQEQAGDVGVWTTNSAVGTGVAGHTDIVVTPGFVGFDSNWSSAKNQEGYPIAEQVTHNYTGMLGFLRIKEIDVGVTIQGSPCAVSTSDKRIDVFARGSDNNLWQKTWNGSWQDWVRVGTSIFSDPAVSSWGADRYDVFATGQDGSLQHWFWPSGNGGWSGPESLGTP